MGTPLQVSRTQGILSCSLEVSRRMMSRVALLLPLIAAASAAPEARFSCEECVREMHGLAAMVKMGAIPIHDYIRDNYCPTLDSTAAQHFCEDSLSKYYVGMLFAVVEHWFVDGALHVCQTAGTCDAREYTCDDCKQLVEEHFTGMHTMAMEKFFIPTEICMQEPVCGGSPTFPPKPTDGPDA